MSYASPAAGSAEGEVRRQNASLDTSSYIVDGEV
jgi:hypothetical protein